MSKILLNADVDYALRMWTGTNFVKELSSRGHEVLIFTPFGKDIYGLGAMLALTTSKVLRGSFKDDARRFHNKDIKDIPQEYHNPIRAHIHQMLNTVDISIVSSAGERFLNQEIVRISKERGKPVIYMIEGLNNAEYGIPIYPDAIFVWGDVMRQTFLNGVKNSKPAWPQVLKVTGAPRFDAHFEEANSKYATRVKQILVAMPCYHKEYNVDEGRAVMAGIARAGIEGVHVLIHPHPGSPDELWHGLAKEYKIDSYMVDRKKLIVDCIAESEIVVTGASTIALEAMIFDKPIVCLSAFRHLETQRHFKPLYSSNAKYLATNYAEVANAVKQAFAKPMEQSENRKELARRYFANGGSASKACADEIEKMVK